MADKKISGVFRILGPRVAGHVPAHEEKEEKSKIKQWFHLALSSWLFYLVGFFQQLVHQNCERVPVIEIQLQDAERFLEAFP